MKRTYRRGYFLVVGIAALALGTAEGHAAPPRLGVMVDAGVPDGVNGSLVVKPARWLSLHGGGGTNLVSGGVRAGASLFLLPYSVSPTVNLEAGRYFEGNANGAAERLGAMGGDNPLLREVGYDYANFHGGIDMGRERVSFYLHAGLSRLQGQIRNLNESIAQNRDSDATDASYEPTLEVKSDPTFTLIAPSARVGMVVYF